MPLHNEPPGPDDEPNDVYIDDLLDKLRQQWVDNEVEALWNRNVDVIDAVTSVLSNNNRMMRMLKAGRPEAGVELNSLVNIYFHKLAEEITPQPTRDDL